ncbi:alpha/beta-Hydrolases superfamily protein [Actinidia rufa]|uniref:Alpha/beta-Hydrolases superfamily protein n=1 Tax=Actinidia rufa TaxID=165716 RepID=A0A7J0GDZ6_9ERIC|nr:alpha/beta-Hydrolases superfamily protein [Actinidia rufa]
MEGIEHRTITVNGINMHIAEKGKGPIILFLHGFPELWYSWRHQILHRGGSRLPRRGALTSAATAAPPAPPPPITPSSPSSTSSATSPDRVRALVNLSVHFIPRNPSMKPVEMLRGLYGDDHYICRFQLRKFLTYRDPAQFRFPKGKGFGDSPDTPVVLPLWLSKEDVDYYASKFEQTGFTGGINYYRTFDLTWELTAPWTGSQVKVPAKFIVGDLDLVYNIRGVKEYIHDGGFKKAVPLLDEVVVMEGVGHFINQERPDEISKHILDFFKKF